jgi:hypothetical protein
MRVLIAGSITRDTNFVNDDARSDWGGTVVYAARTYDALGVPCRILTSAAEPVGEAFPATAELIVRPSPVTTAFENHYQHDQSRLQRAPSTAPPLAFDRTALAGVTWVHLGPLHPDDLTLPWYQIDAAPCALDVQGLTRRIVNGEVVAHADPGAVDHLRRMRWLKASVREWSLLGCPALQQGELTLSRGIEGGDVLVSDNTWNWRADPAISGCDPTGAGDVFFAAYLTHRNGGDPPATAARNAARFTSAFLRNRMR